jgi:hypothetical protein
LTRNPKTVVANDNETSITLAMRLVQTEERYEAAQLAEADARQLYARTRTEADHRVAFDTWCERNYLGHEIEKLAAAGAARLRDEQAMPRARAARARSRWAEWMAWTCPDTRWRDSHFPELIGMRPASKPRLDGLPLYQSPEWRRLEALGQRHLEIWRASLDAEKLAPQKQKLKEAFGKKTRDQDGVWVNAQVPSRPKQSAEQGRCYRLWTEGQLKAKLAAELDSHELSRDWDGLKEEQVAYAWVMGELLAGREVYRHKLDPKHWAVLSKVHENGAVLLACNDNTIISAYSDPDIEPDEDREEPHPWPSYPGCPADRHPKAGKYLGAKGADAVVRAWRAMKGERTFDKAIAEWINTRREMLGFTEDDRYISVENCGRIRRELVEAGRLIQKLAAEHYRREHVWRTLAAACRSADEPDRRAGGKMSKAEIDEAFKGIAADLRSRTSGGALLMAGSQTPGPRTHTC